MSNPEFSSNSNNQEARSKTANTFPLQNQARIQAIKFNCMISSIRVQSSNLKTIIRRI